MTRGEKIDQICECFFYPNFKYKFGEFETKTDEVGQYNRKDFKKLTDSEVNKIHKDITNNYSHEISGIIDCGDLKADMKHFIVYE